MLILSQNKSEAINTDNITSYSVQAVNIGTYAVKARATKIDVTLGVYNDENTAKQNLKDLLEQIEQYEDIHIYNFK